MLNKFRILRKLNAQLEYDSIIEYIGTEIPLDISKSGEVIAKEIISIVGGKFGVKVKSIKENNIEKTIAKYGIIDLNLEICSRITSSSGKGIQLLKDNGWIGQDTGNSSSHEDFDFYEEMLSEISEN